MALPYAIFDIIWIWKTLRPWSPCQGYSRSCKLVSFDYGLSFPISIL